MRPSVAIKVCCYDLQWYFIIPITEHSTAARLRCILRYHEPVEGFSFSTVDLFLSTVSIWSIDTATTSGDRPLIVARPYQSGQGAEPGPAESLIGEGQHGYGRLAFRDLVVTKIKSWNMGCVAGKLVMSARPGFILRNDVVRRRFLSCHLAEYADDFTVPRQQVWPFEKHNQGTISAVLDGALGFVKLKDVRPSQPELVQTVLSSLQAEIHHRLAFPWIIDKPLPRKRLAIVEGRPHFRSSDAAKGPLEAAAALGIELVILDGADHWLRHETYRDIHVTFIVCDIAIDEQLPDRILAAVKDVRHELDGLITFSDKHLAATAMAAEALGIATYPAEAIQCCTDKGKMRQMAAPNTLYGSVKHDSKFVISDLQKLATESSWEYPIIVKPSRGNSSEGVTLAHTEAELIGAVESLRDQYPDRTLLLEKYADGPEVDANVVLFNGEAIFSEVNDDFPSTAEMHNTPQQSRSFAEQSTIIPSVLPAHEQSMLIADLTSTLALLGFNSGLFHMEARVTQSQMAYGPKHDALELLPRATNQDVSPKHQASTFLIEINARTPGHQESIAVEYTHGVDYYGLYLLLALRNPGPRAQATDADALSIDACVRALNNPFPEHLRYPTNLVFIPVTRGGILKEVQKLPACLMAHVVWHKVMLDVGAVVEDPKTSGKWPFIACFVVLATVCGQEGRENVRSIGEQIRQQFKYVIK
jgi:biotin carboxylase